MDRTTLEALLEEGHSLEQIGRRVGKHASTVGYWVEKHGLRAVHRDKYAPRGGIPRDVLESLVQEGLSVRAIATTLDLSYATVRYWLKRYAVAIDSPPRGRREPGDPREVTRRCRRHGTTTFFAPGKNPYYRCAKCSAERVAEQRRRNKERLVEELGGQCALCGYDRYQGALHFHHVDPSAKSFHLAWGGVTKSLARLREEARKCVLLCANCHAEVEGGVVGL